MGDPGMPFDAAASAVLAFYRSRGRTPMVQVEVGSDTDAWFGEAGWQVVTGGDSLFMLGSIARARRLLPPVVGATLTDDGDRASADVGDRAHARAGLDGDWLGVHGLRVEQESRRQGLARAVMAALLDWGAEHGATTLWLHVETDNEPAVTLYESMGLDVHHGCRYLSPGS
jgi:GNAT superfamily N-acetyltransferase